jgi:predicted Zn finger-like uncharacterized protein
MILGCPNCGARFRVQADALGPTGRQVRCRRCRHEWHATTRELRPEPASPAAPAVAAAAPARAPASKPPRRLKPTAAPAKPKPAPKPAAPPPPPPPPPPPSPEPVAAEPEPLPPLEPPPLPAAEDAKAPLDAPAAADSSFEAMLAKAVTSSAAKKAPPKPGIVGRIAKIAGWVVFILAAGGLAAAAVEREAVMDAFPKTQPVYAFFGFDIPPPGDGLRLTNVSSSRTTVDGTAALVIDGKVTNTTSTRRSIPPMRGSLRDAKDQELQAWTFNAETEKLDAGETTSFHTEVKQPSAQATGLSISFISGSAK